MTRGLPACFEQAHAFFLSGESSRRGKAGALWETAFPLLRPLPSPRSTPSLALASTLRAPAPASPSPRPQRAARLPSGWTVELHAACRAKVSGKVLREIPCHCRSSRTLGRGGGSREKPCSRTLGRKEGAAEAPRLGRRRASRSSLPTRHLARKPRDALGRRAAEGVPDSRAAVSGARARSAREPCEQGRRHLVVN